MPNPMTWLCLLAFAPNACVTPAERVEYVQHQEWDKLNEQCRLSVEGVVIDEDFYKQYCKGNQVNVDAVKQAKGKQ